MLTNNNNTSSSAPPPPPPPLPLGGLKNWKLPQDNGNSNKPYGNSGTNNSTQSEKGLSESPIQLATEQKIDTPILINTLVRISKAAALKYSIATLLLCISSVTAGIYTYLSISATLSAPVLFTVIASVSSLVVLSLAVYLINSFVSAINSEKGVDPGREQSQDSGLQKAKGLEHSNSANTPTSSLPVMSGTSIVPPPPPPAASKHTEQHKDTNILEETKNKTLKKVEDKPKNDNGNAALLNDIAKVNVKEIMNEEQKRKRDEKIKQSQKKVEEREEKGKKEREDAGKETEKDMNSALKKKLASRRTGIAGEEENVVQPLNGVYGKISSMIPSPRSRSSSLSSNNSDESWNSDDEYLASPTSQLGRRENPDSGHDNTKPEPTTPPRSTLKAEKPPVPPKPPNLRVNL